MDLVRLSASEIARLIREREISAVEVMEETRAVAEHIQETCNAFVTLDWPAALDEAARCDREIRHRSGDLPSLYGVPFSVKDLLNTRGMRTTYGSRAYEANVPDADVAAVARFRAAGALLIGKTTTPEFAAQVLTDCELTGISRNPWNRSLTPGGSSGGAGIAAAAGAGTLAISTDGGGSSRIPAAACGVLGLKPTLGAIPHESWPFHYGNNSSISMNCRHPVDLVAMFNTMAGAHPQDPWSRRSVRPVEIPIAPDDLLKGKRVLFLPALAGLSCDPQLLLHVEGALNELRSMGVEVESSSADPTSFSPEIATQMMAANLAARVRNMLPEQQDLLGPVLQSLLDEARYRPDGVAIQEDAISRSLLYDRLESQLANYDLIVTPTLNAPPPPADPTEDQRVVINGKKEPLTKWWSHLSIANLTGHPAISIPCGFDDSGLPVGLHAIAGWDCEQQLIDLAFAISSFHDWTANTPSLAALSVASLRTAAGP
jgi:aspartyl-tRNA(Asn)/glutamyl-tRNA(Gln) amidotransferase subunit A